MGSASDVIISVRPEHARNIVSGRKTVELRRRFPQDRVLGRLMLIYSSSPDQAMIGATVIRSVQRMSVPSLWRSFRDQACVSRKTFLEYFCGVHEGFGVVLGPVIQFSHAIPVAELRDRFSFCPPQSYRYVEGQLTRLLDDERIQIPDRHKHRDRSRGQPSSRQLAG